MIQIQYLSTAPEITGDVSTGVWAKLVWHEKFATPGLADAKPSLGTAFAMAHDEDNLYVAVRCCALADESQEQLARENVQVQIDSERNGQRAGIFVCYADGTASSIIVLEVGGKEGWSGEIGYAASLESGQWSIVLKVPLSQLQHFGEGLTRLHFNISRVTDTPPGSWLTYPTLEEIQFWMPHNAIAEAEFERPELLEAFAWEVQRAGRGRINRNNGEAVCRQGVMSTNFSAEDRDVDLRVELIQADKASLGSTHCRLSIGAGESHIEYFELPVPAEFEYGSIHVSLHDSNTGRCVSENQILVETEQLSWKEHFVKRGDGHGGYTCHAAQQQFLPRYEGRLVVPYGLAAMENGEIICAVYAWPGPARQPDQTLIAISGDGGSTWGEYIVLDGIRSRPMMLAYLGNGVVTFESGDTTELFRLFSHDHGRTWDERVAVEPAPDGQPLGFEGNPLVDRDEQGNAICIAQTGQTMEGAAPNWKIHNYIRWSQDGGRTWPRVDCPQAWRSLQTYNGKTFDFGCGEGSLVRAANGNLVAALRTWVPPQLLNHPHNGDSLEGTAVSISKDDGATWLPQQMVFEGGRHHAALLCMPDGDLVMVVIRRIDYRNGQLASYRRGCDAIVSRDHGVTWDIQRMFVLDDFPYCEGEQWSNGECGHLCSELLPDGSIITGYGNYIAGGVLIRWKPE